MRENGPNDQRLERTLRGGPATLHPALVRAFEALDRAGSSWCLLRTPSNLRTPAGDVDLLVARRDHARARGALEAAGFVRIPVWGPAYRRDPEAFYLSYSRAEEHPVYVHAVTELSFGPYHSLGIPAHATGGILHRARRQGALVLPDPDDAFWALLLHCLLDKGAIGPRYRARLHELSVAARSDTDLALATEAACRQITGGAWGAAQMLECARQAAPRDWASLEDLALRLAAAWPRRFAPGWNLPARAMWVLARVVGLLRYQDYRLYAGGKWREALANPVRGTRSRARPRPVHGAGPRTSGEQQRARSGLTVALIGPDGSGKSTLTSGLEGAFTEFGGVRTLYMGLGYAGLPRLARLPVPGSRAAVGLATLWWRYLKARHHRARGRLVVFDRYTYDALLPTRRRLPLPRRFMRGVWARACPHPDLTLLLDVPGAIVYGRRREKSPEELEAARQDFLTLRERIPGLQVVDASRPEEAVRRDVADRIRHRAGMETAAHAPRGSREVRSRPR